jgi:cytochrome P450
VNSVTIAHYEAAAAALRHHDLAQSLYDEGAVIMKDVLLTLHGDAHRARRVLELRVFRRDFFRVYENETFPATLAETIAPFERAGRADLIDLGYRVTMNLTADFAGVDRTRGNADETEHLRRLVMTFSEGATLVHSTRDKEAVRAEVRAALGEFDQAFYQRSAARRRDLLVQFARGAITEDALPRDVLTVLLRNEDRLELPHDLMLREIAFYLQAGSHSTANATTHAFHDLLVWGNAHPDDRDRIARDPLFLQRCVHESLRLHPASPVAWRRATCPVQVASNASASMSESISANTDDRVIIDLATANQDPSIFGADADRFNPHRELPPGVPPWGLTFGTGLHMCLGRDLDGGVVPRADTDPATHQYGIVPLFVRALFARHARPDPTRPPVPATKTARPNWGSYPILLTA